MSAARSWVSLGVLAAVSALAQPRVGSPVPVTPDAPGEGQAQARAVGTDAGFFVVWQAGVGRGAKVRGARLGLDGASQDRAGLTLAEGPGGRFEPAVAFGHGVVLLVWSDLRDGYHAVYGARVSPQGAVLDPGGRLLSTEPGARMPDVAATPTGFVVGWAQAVEGGQGTEARARLLDSAGAPLDAPLRLTTARAWTAGEDLAHASIARAYCQNVRVAVQGPVAFVAWMGNLGHSQDMRVARALVDTATGTVLDAAAFATPPPQSRVWDPALAPLGDGGVLVTWTDFRGRGMTGLPAHNAVVAPLAPADAGVSLVSLRADGGARAVLRPAVAASGVVAFSEGVENPQRDRRVEYRLRLRVVEADGTSPGADVTLPEQAVWPALVTGPTGVTLLVTTTVNDVAGQTGRLLARIVTR